MTKTKKNNKTKIYKNKITKQQTIIKSNKKNKN